MRALFLGILFVSLSVLSLSILSFANIAFSQSTEKYFPKEKQQESTKEDYTISPYDLATDEQIAEAQRFYESCKNNATMSKQKDCRCAAASYLETRVNLGDAASVEEIMRKNINTCLRDSKKSAVLDVDALGLENVTEAQMKEALGVYDWCNKNNRVKNQTDCECLAAKFLDLRIKRGPIVGKDVLILEVTQKDCRNVVETTGIEFSRCMKGSGFSYFNIRPKDYCECYARMWGKLFKSYKGRMTTHKKASIRLMARNICSKPETYVMRK